MRTLLFCLLLLITDAGLQAQEVHYDEIILCADFKAKVLNELAPRAGYKAVATKVKKRKMTTAWYSIPENIMILCKCKKDKVRGVKSANNITTWNKRFDQWWYPRFKVMDDALGNTDRFRTPKTPRYHVR